MSIGKRNSLESSPIHQDGILNRRKNIRNVYIVSGCVVLLNNFICTSRFCFWWRWQNGTHARRVRYGNDGCRSEKRGWIINSLRRFRGKKGCFVYIFLCDNRKSFNDSRRNFYARISFFLWRYLMRRKKSCDFDDEWRDCKKFLMLHNILERWTGILGELRENVTDSKRIWILCGIDFYKNIFLFRFFRSLKLLENWINLKSEFFVQN